MWLLLTGALVALAAVAALSFRGGLGFGEPRVQDGEGTSSQGQSVRGEASPALPAPGLTPPGADAVGEGTAAGSPPGVGAPGATPVPAPPGQQGVEGWDIPGNGVVDYPGPAVAAGTSVAEVRNTLDTLVVAPRAPWNGYTRQAFGPAWSDVDRNGCDQRNDVLGRDLREVRRRGECVVTAGVLRDPYTAATTDFRRGWGSSEQVQIDHVVALGDAWVKGAQGWSPQQREAFANDPANLLAVDGDANQDKGARDAGSYLPPNEGYRCTYVATQIEVKHRYGLSVSQKEKEALARQLSSC